MSLVGHRYIQRLQTMSVRAQWVLFIIGIIAIVLLLQSQTLHGQFLSDDYDWVRNARIRVTSHNWIDAFNTSTGGNFYRPLPAFSFQVDYAMWGYRTVGYHIHQLVFHIALIIGIAFMLWSIFRKRALAFSVAALFAVYPAHHEVITWIAGRPDLYAATFTVFAIGCFVLFLQKKKWWQYALFLLLSVCAFLSKEIAFCLPALAVCVTFFVIPIKEWRKILIGFLWLLPLLALLGGVLLVRSHIISDAIGGYLSEGGRKGLDFQMKNIAKPFTSILYLVNWSYAVQRLGHTGVWMKAQFLKIVTYSLWLGASCFLAALAVQIGIWFRWKNRLQLKLWLFGVAWSLIAFVPVFGLSHYIATNLTASRLFFLSSVGYACLFVAYLWPFAQVKGWKHIWKGAYAGFMILLMGLWLFNSVPWKSASQQVTTIRQALAKQHAVLIPENTNAVLVSGLPGLIHGAYMYFGVHSIRETMYEITRNDKLQTFLVGNRAYSDSPLCGPTNLQLASIRWNAGLRTFIPTHTQALDVLTSGTPSQPVVWDFRDPSTVQTWNVSNITYTQQAGGIALTIPKLAKTYLETPSLPQRLLGSYRSVDVRFTITDMATDPGGQKISLMWPVNHVFTAGNSIQVPVGQSKNVVLHIPTCQYLSWGISDAADNLRILPITSGTILLESITLNIEP